MNSAGIFEEFLYTMPETFKQISTKNTNIEELPIIQELAIVHA